MTYPKQDELNCSNCTKRSIEIHYPEFHDYLCNKYPELSWSEKLYWFYNNITKYPLCTCGNKTSFVNFRIGYRKFCCYKCMSNDLSVKESKRLTSQKNYGVDNPMHSQVVKNKLIETNINKYGVSNASQSKQVLDKIKETNRIKFGVDYPMQNRDCVQKMLLTRKQQTLDDIDDLISITPDYQYIMRCPHLNCNKCEEKCYQIRSSVLYDRKRLNAELCTKLSPVGQYTKGTSLELFVRSILDEHHIEYTTNDRNTISPKELDIYIPSKHIAIECNGIYWHASDKTNYKQHMEKFLMCKEKGVQLLTIWEDWIINNRNIIKSIILSKLGIYENRLYARNLHIDNVSIKDSNQFLNENHIQGKCPSQIRLGLYQNDKLLGLMTFSKKSVSTMRSHNKDTWSLTRFCTLKHTQIIGGAEKLLTHFIREYHPKDIDSFSSNDISNGNLYKKLGFEQGPVNQSYWYIDKDTFKRYHRASFTKDSIIERGWKDNKEGWTESDVMAEHGYYQIYDSGQTKWSLTL